MFAVTEKWQMMQRASNPAGCFMDIFCLGSDSCRPIITMSTPNLVVNVCHTKEDSYKIDLND